MKVWIVTEGQYTTIEGIAGVFDDPDLAIQFAKISPGFVVEPAMDILTKLPVREAVLYVECFTHDTKLPVFSTFRTFLAWEIFDHVEDNWLVNDDDGPTPAVEVVSDATESSHILVRGTDFDLVRSTFEEVRAAAKESKDTVVR